MDDEWTNGPPEMIICLSLGHIYLWTHNEKIGILTKPLLQLIRPRNIENRYLFNVIIYISL